MAKRTKDDSDEEDQLREDDDDHEEAADESEEEDVKPKKKAAPKKKVEPNFKKGGKKSEVEEKKKKPAAKKARTSGEGSSNGQGVQTNEEGDGFIELGGSKRVTVREYMGRTLVDIREYYTDKNTQEEKPGKKGISLNSTQFKALVDSIGLLEGLL